MPLPAPPPLQKVRHISKKARALLPPVPPEDTPITLPALEHVFYDKDIRKSTGLRCRTCLRFHRCTLGPQQMLQCFAYFLYQPGISTNPNLGADVTFLQNLSIPLEADALNTLNALSTEQLLGVFFLRNYSLHTLVDITPRGLRTRLTQITQDTLHPSPYLLTTE